MGIAKGSAGEVKYQLMLARDLGYITDTRFSEMHAGYERISQMLTGLAKALS